MPPALTPGAIEKILTAPPDAPPMDPRPTLQVFDLKELKSKTTDASGGPRFRLLASDGAHATQGLFAQGLNAMCAAGEIVKFSILRVRDYVVQDVNGKKCVGRRIDSDPFLFFRRVAWRTQHPRRISNAFSSRRSRLDACGFGNAWRKFCFIRWTR